jgi:thiol:disulfide interchange protein
MNKPLRPVLGIFVILCFVVAASMVARAMRPKEIVTWRTDFAAARQESRSTGKPVFAYFTASWCAPCQSLKHTTWADKNVEAGLRNYVPVKIDVDQNQELARQYNVRAVPSFAVLGGDGELLKQVDGALPPKELLNWLRAMR